VATLVAALALLTSTSAVAATPTPVSHELSPYASCATPAAGGTNYVSGEVEPYVANNPHAAGNLIAVWQQDRWSNGGSHGLASGYSTDDGASWTQTTLPFSSCAPGGLPFERASDPWVSIGPDGTAYVNGLCFNSGANLNSGVCAATSADGGQSWANAQVVELDKTRTGTELNDKNSITADPVQAGVAYQVWDDVSSPFLTPHNFTHVFGFQGDALLSKTTNGGKTWSSPRIIVRTGNYSQTIGNIIVVNPQNGTVYDFFDLILGTNKLGTYHGQPPSQPSPFNVAFIKSTDGGSSWTNPQIIANLRSVGENNVRDGGILPEPAIDPSSGQIYVVWQDSRFSGGSFDQVAIATSTDGGTTWTMNAAPVNDQTGQPAFTPMVSVNSSGSVGVTYYQFASTGPYMTNTLAKTSSNHGVTFTSASSIAPTFDMSTAPNAGGFFVGDYEGLTTNGNEFHPVFVTTTASPATNPTDVFAATF
jgi:hypothetical protein